ncbi:lipoprotein signal peptidase [Pusillimonas sp. T7-7]|nr:lipoprotein signal peptidase [Pusillimonas sp. T7-7]
MITAAYVSIVAGALGNVIDRVRLGTVVDYLDFHWEAWHWPAFNLADVLVVGGAIFLALSSFTFPRNQMKQAT